MLKISDRGEITNQQKASLRTTCANNPSSVPKDIPCPCCLWDSSSPRQQQNFPRYKRRKQFGGTGEGTREGAVLLRAALMAMPARSCQRFSSAPLRPATRYSHWCPSVAISPHGKSLEETNSSTALSTGDAAPSWVTCRGGLRVYKKASRRQLSSAPPNCRQLHVNAVQTSTISNSQKSYPKCPSYGILPQNTSSPRACWRGFYLCMQSHRVTVGCRGV